MLKHSVLVLNRSWLAVHVANVRRAVSLVYRGSARVVSPDDFATYSFERWQELSETAPDDGRVLHTVQFKLRVPDVIVLTFFNRFHRRDIAFSRRTLIERDGLTCQYCGEPVARTNLTVDHVVPRSQGGRNTWENLVLACPPCNLRKGDRTPEQASMPLRRAPQKPPWHPFASAVALAARRPAWRPFLVPAAWDADAED